MSSKVDKIDALIMRRRGYSLSEIGEKYGVTRERIRQIVGRVDIGEADCAYCGERFKKKTARHRFCSRSCGTEFNHTMRTRAHDECPSCGGLKTVASSRCRKCQDASYCRAERDALVEKMWADGAPMEEIAQAIGATVAVLGQRINRMRRAGANLPYRRHVFPKGEPTFPEQVR